MLAMKELILVASGGALGAIARWQLGAVILHHTADWRFPLPTLTVNLAGCATAGAIAGLIIKQDMFSPAMRLFLLTGLLGGFTTFSAFGVECMYLIRRGEFAVVGWYVLLSVAGGMAALLLALRLVPGQPHQP
jgi:CrcB protein